MNGRAALAAVLLVLGTHLGLAGSASAGVPMVTITACEQIDVGGETHPRFTFRIHNTSSASICFIYFHNPYPPDPADSCIVVANGGPAGPSGFDASVFDNFALWVGCGSDEIGPGETREGFQLVTTSACCGQLHFLHGTSELVAVEDLCLQCPTPAERATWGLVKSRYR